MKKLAAIALFLLCGALAHAQTTLQASLTWTATNCAATVTTDTNGVEISGPCLSQIYRVSVAAGAACPAFSTTTYTLIQAAQVENAAQAAYIDSSVTVGAVYCYAVTDTNSCNFPIAKGASLTSGNAAQVNFIAGTINKGALDIYGGVKAAFEWDANGLKYPSQYTVSTLPSCGASIKGAESSVTDATSPTFLGTLTGGGAVLVPVMCNGTAWVSY